MLGHKLLRKVREMSKGESWEGASQALVTRME